MPYIKAEDREKFEPYIKDVVVAVQTDGDVEAEHILEFAKLITSAGEANYAISSILWRLFDTKPSYTYGNMLISVVEDVKAVVAHKNSWTDQTGTTLYEVLKFICFHMKNRVPCVRGMLACVVLEFYRRRLAGYEDGAITRNGDI